MANEIDRLREDVMENLFGKVSSSLSGFLGYYHDLSDEEQLITNDILIEMASESYWADKIPSAPSIQKMSQERVMLACDALKINRPQ